MLHQTNQAQCNVEQPSIEEASRAALVQLLHQHAGGAFVLSTSQVAALLGKSEAAFRLAESRYRGRHGRDMLPKPLFQNNLGRCWSIAQIAAWLTQGPELAPTSLVADQPRKRPGRPRKAVSTMVAP
jgi:hypothetical protein